MGRSVSADRAPNQRIHLDLLAGFMEAMDDPDWQVLVRGRGSFKEGLPLGARKLLPRTPAVYGRKVAWRRSEPEDSGGHPSSRENYASCVEHVQ